MTLNEWRDKIHSLAVDKGWWDERLSIRTPLEIHALIHSEISEATEAVRSNAPSFYYDGTWHDKPEGEAVELVDAVIRIFDYFGYKQWDLEAILKEKTKYNEGRAARHGGKLF